MNDAKTKLAIKQDLIRALSGVVCSRSSYYSKLLELAKSKQIDQLAMHMLDQDINIRLAAGILYDWIKEGRKL